MTLHIKEYTSVPQLDVKSSVTLTVALLSATPPEAGEVVRAATAKLRTVLNALKAGWAAREGRQTDKRSFDRELGRSWRALHDVVNAVRSLSEGPRYEAAQRAYSALFEHGLAFTRATYARQWAESARLLELIESDALEKAVNTAAGGPELLERVRQTHAAFGRAVSVTEAEVDREVDFRKQLAELRSAIVNYAVSVVVWSAVDDTTELAARNALKPIDRMRSAQARRSNRDPASGADLDRDVTLIADEAEPDPDATTPGAAWNPTRANTGGAADETPIPWNSQIVTGGSRSLSSGNNSGNELSTPTVQPLL